MIKRIIAICLLLALCIMSVSCKKDDGAPDGMKSVTVAGEPFILYVPDSWVENESSGISSAYYISTNTIMVTARYETAVQDVTLQKYMESCAEKYGESLQNFNGIELVPSVLGGKDALNMKYTMVDKNGKTLTCRQVTTKHGEDFVSLNFYCEAELFEANNKQFEDILAAFVLAEKVVINDELTDDKTPEGMKIASSDNTEYRFYVPKTWVCNSEALRSEAYFPESGKPNVTITTYADSAIDTADKYFAFAEAEYKKTISGYELISKEDAGIVGNRYATSYTYRAVYDGVEFRIRQTIFVFASTVYSITYTALADSFDAHVEDVNKMLEAFEFRG
jgi:hypothetical protein